MESYQPASSSLTLTVNRLSGELSSALRTSNASLSVLEGNIFGCPLLRTDENSKGTECGSSNLEYPFIAWLVALVAIVIVMIYLSYSSLSIAIRVQQHILKWWRSSCRLNISNELCHTMTTIRYLERACSMVVIISLFFVLVVMLSFIGMKLQGRSHTNTLYQVQYLYTPTSAYLVGQTPTVLIWLYVTLSGLLVTAICVAIKPLESKRCKDKLEAQRIDNSGTSEGRHLYQIYQDHIKSAIVRLIVEVIVSAISIGINIGFVEIVYFGEPSNLTAVNIAFGIIKSLVSATVVPYSSKLVAKASQQSHRVLMAIMVTVIGPGLAVLITSPLCLYYYFKKQQISASYQFPTVECSLIGDCHDGPLLSDVSIIEPTWFYSYACSSSYLTSYLPNFIVLYIISGIVSPLVSLLGMILISTDIVAKYAIYRQRYWCFECLNYMLQLIDDKLMVGKIFYIGNDSKTTDTCTVSTSSLSASGAVEMSVLHEQHSNSTNSMIESASTTVSSWICNFYSSQRSGSVYDIDVEELMPSLCVDITMLLTFGLASPLLAIIVSFSIIINTILWRLALGRYITIVSKATSSRACYEKLERAFENEWHCLPRSWWLMSVFIGLFWSMFVFDMIGDRDPSGGIVAAVLMIVWCPCVFISLQWLLSVDPDADTDRTTSDTDSMLHKMRNKVHDVSSRVHDVMWKHVLRLSSCDSISSSTSNSNSSNSSSSSSSTAIDIISEFISPLSHRVHLTPSTIGTINSTEGKPPMSRVGTN